MSFKSFSMLQDRARGTHTHRVWYSAQLLGCNNRLAPCCWFSFLLRSQP